MQIFSRNPFRRNNADSIENEDEPSGHRRIILVSGLALLVLLAAFGCWLGFRTATAKSQLEQARADARQAKQSLLEGNTEDAIRSADNAASHAAKARDATASLPWTVAAAIPWIGSPFETGQQISDVVLHLATDVLQPSTKAGAALSPDRLLVGNRIDVELLRQQEPELVKISEDATRLNDRAQAIPQPTYLSALADARVALQSQTADVTELLKNTALASQLAPSMLGADGPRTYFMGFQTNAEARGTGGLLGSFGILRFENGAATVNDLGPNDNLGKNFAPIDLGPDYADQYGFTNPTTDYRNSNLSSHFPYAAQIWRSMWQQQSGSDVDGVIAIDPVALSYVLGATGAITMPDGEQVTKDNVVELTESTAYKRFPTDQVARQRYLQEIANRVVTKMTTEKLRSPSHLLEALGKAVSERRIAVWSSSPKEETLLEQTPLAHTIPTDDAPYAEIVINNLAGNKLDYYLSREIEYAADGCGADTRNSTITVKLASTVPNEPLPDYVAGSSGLTKDFPLRVKSGTMITSVKLIATNGAKLLTVLSNGIRVPVIPGTERGHPSFEAQVAIPPGKSGELTFRLTEPVAAGKARVPIQPLIDDVKPVIAVPECTG